MNKHSDSLIIYCEIRSCPCCYEVRLGINKCNNVKTCFVKLSVVLKVIIVSHTVLYPDTFLTTLSVKPRILLCIYSTPSIYIQYFIYLPHVTRFVIFTVISPDLAVSSGCRRGRGPEQSGGQMRRRPVPK